MSKYGRLFLGGCGIGGGVPLDSHEYLHQFMRRPVENTPEKPYKMNQGCAAAMLKHDQGNKRHMNTSRSI